MAALLLAISLGGCPAHRPDPAGRAGGDPTGPRVAERELGDSAQAGLRDPHLVSGRADFGAGRKTQASTGDVVAAATVSFIDTATNTTVATGKTDGAGRFSLNLAGFDPVQGATYLLEAVKGLGNQAPGAAAARLRTLLLWNGSGWLSCTNAATSGPIVINALTTALAIEAALDPAAVPALETVGKVDAQSSPAKLNAAPGPYSNHPDDEIRQLAADLLAYLGMDLDPVQATPAILPAIAALSPSSGAANGLIRMSGSGFSPVPSGNTVTFAGAAAQVVLATPTSLIAVVPASAGTGAVKVQTGRGSATGPVFTVVSGTAALNLASFEPGSGAAGSRVILRGEFGQGTGVVKLGALEAPIATWSPEAVEVTVPWGAATGRWTVQVGTLTAAASGTYAVKRGDIGQFRYVYDAQMFPWPTLYGEQKEPVVIGDYAYLIGGVVQFYGGVVPDVMRVKLHPDGSLGAFEWASRLTSGLHHASAIHIGDWLYVIGGHDGNQDLTRVQRARINADGTLGLFSNYRHLNVARHSGRVVAVAGWLYVIGGWGDPPVERAKINEDGSLGAFETLSIRPPAGWEPQWPGWPLVFAAADRIYVLGGQSAGLWRRHGMIIKVNPDGSLDAPVLASNVLAETRYASGQFTHGGAFYILGGQNPQAQSTVERLTVNPDGTLNPGTTVGRLIQGRWITTPVVAGKRVYVWGGAGAGNLQNLETAEINDDGTLQAFRTLGNSVSSYGHGIARIGDRIVKAGGLSTTTGDLSLVESATIQADGGLSPFRQIGSLVTPRRHTNAVATGKYLYVIGGHLNGSGLRTIERAEIKPDGNLGSFAILPRSLVLPRWATNSKIVGKYLYVTGGNSPPLGMQRSIERAEILADGSLGPFEIYAGSYLRTARDAHGFVAIGDYAYVFGGNGGSAGFLSSVERAPIGPDGSLGPFVPHGDLPIVRHGLDSDGFGIVGGYLYVFGGYNAGGDDRVVRAPIGERGALGAWEVVGPHINTARWHHSAIVTEAFVYLIGGVTNSGSSYDRVEVSPWR